MEASNLLFLDYREFGADSDKLSGIDKVVSLTLMEFVKFLSYCYFSIWVIKYCLEGINEFFIGLKLDYARDKVHIEVELELGTSREVRHGIGNFASVLYILDWVQ